MSTFKQGVHGGFSGKIGNVVGSSWKGMGVMKIRPARVGNPRTLPQQSNRGRFQRMGRFLSSMNALIRIGWKSAEFNTTAFNEAMRYNISAAVDGEFPNQFIDFSKVKLSNGKLPVPSDLQVSAASALSLNVNWQDNSTQPLANGSDLFMLGVYDAESGDGYTLSGGFTRQQETAVVTLPDNWKNRRVEVFVFLVSTQGLGLLSQKEHISPTVYAGSIQLADS